jgi:hypothetical protein
VPPPPRARRPLLRDGARPLLLPLLALFVAASLLVTGLRLVAVAQVPAATRRPSTLTERLWDFPSSPAGPTRVGVLLPPTRAAGERWPVLIALSGWGESARGPETGVWGWAHDYELGASDAELRRPRLRREAFLGFVAPPRLEALRRDLARRPYRGLVVVTPYTPDVLDLDGGDLSAAWGDWLVSTVLPRVRAELPVLATRGSTGIDGVSLGGLLALETGLRHPEAFGAVGSLQPAVRRRVERVMARLAPAAARPPQRIRLLATRQDGLTRDVTALHAAMTARGFTHEFRVVEGPHDYVFNRGAGGVEMLLFHDRALRGEPSP